MVSLWKSTATAALTDRFDAAIANAREQAIAIQNKVAGNLDAVGDYEVAIREEIIQEIDRNNIVSRNRYGALVLNSENVAFIDIDEPRIGFWKRLFGKKNLTKKQQMMEMIEQEAARADYDGLGFRVYETHSGMRLIITGRKFVAGSAESRKLLDAFNSDPLYAVLCAKQQCYTANTETLSHAVQRTSRSVSANRRESSRRSRNGSKLTKRPRSGLQRVTLLKNLVGHEPTISSSSTTKSRKRKSR